MRRFIAVLIIITAGWMVCDGTRALVVGDYVTPGSGPHAGLLGPWASVVQAVGLAPRSPAMKLIFVGYGLAYLAVLVAWLMRRPWARSALLVVAVLGLWYVPVGTVTNLVVIAWVWLRT